MCALVTFQWIFAASIVQFAESHSSEGIKTDEFWIKNDEFCIKMMNFVLK